MLVGLIADTHGYVCDDSLAAFNGCDLILHAGDVGNGVLGRLREIAPLAAVAGNNDVAGEAAELPTVERLDLEGRRVTLVHRLVDAPAEGWDVLVYGHCHKQHADAQDGRLLVNPGAAGRRGFHRERSVALLTLAPDRPPAVTFVNLGMRREAR